MKRILHKVVDQNNKIIGYSIMCPGCGEVHVLYTSYAGKPQWQFNGNEERPTFTPSLLVYGILPNPTTAYAGSPHCHSFIIDGQMQFLSDSKHKLAGQTVDLMPWGYEDE